MFSMISACFAGLMLVFVMMEVMQRRNVTSVSCCNYPRLVQSTVGLYCCHRGRRLRDNQMTRMHVSRSYVCVRVCVVASLLAHIIKCNLLFCSAQRQWVDSTSGDENTVPASDRASERVWVWCWLAAGLTLRRGLKSSDKSMQSSSNVHHLYKLPDYCWLCAYIHAHYPVYYLQRNHWAKVSCQTCT